MRNARFHALICGAPLLVLACTSSRPPTRSGFVPPGARARPPYGSTYSPPPTAPAPLTTPVPGTQPQATPAPPTSHPAPGPAAGPPPAARPGDILAVTDVPANHSSHPQRHACAGDDCAKRCDPSEPLACIAAGEKWVGMTSHIAQRQKHLAVGCGAGHAESCLNLVRACVGINRFTPACRKGLEDGLRRQRAPEVNTCGGDGCDQGKLLDVAKSRLSRAVGGRCQQGSARDCMVLAKHHDFVQRDATLAGRFYRRSCNLGEPSACQAAASVESDAQKKADLNRRALGLFMGWCDRGMARDCSEASDAFARGVGAKVHVMAARWYAAKACELGQIYCTPKPAER